MTELLREENDYYRTPRECVDALLSVEKIEGPVWECACGDGAISKVLLDSEIEVVSTDLIDRGYGTPGVDFLTTGELLAPTILTNPPFRLDEEFVMRALASGARKVVLLLRLAFLEGAGRHRRLYIWKPPARVWVLSKRPTLWHGGDTSGRKGQGVMPFAWYVWEEGPVPSPGTVLGWIGYVAPPDGLQTALRAYAEAQRRLLIVLRGGL